MRLTATLERVLRAFVNGLGSEQYGYILMREARIKSGTLYPILARLEADGLVSSQWGERPADGKPARKYYKLTPRGTEVARQLLAEVDAENRATRAVDAVRAPKTAT
jgi:DNA-binding PadR family transcriptional regulator